MISIATKARTAWSLGLVNLARVAIYRGALRLGVHRVQRIEAPIPQGLFFTGPTLPPVDAGITNEWHDTARLFGFHEVPIGAGAPDWHANPITGQHVPDPTNAWWNIPDFSDQTGDIKSIWEFSRMAWVLAFAQRARNGDKASLDRCNQWLNDWCAMNPPYLGPNWKCGQEASIRVLHLAMASLIVGQARTTEAPMRDLIEAHLRRIAPTMSYAAAQDNNHATSEAAALFVGGGWLVANGCRSAAPYETTGRRQLEE